MRIRTLVPIMAVLVAALVAAPAAHAATPLDVWGACGSSSAVTKLVRSFPRAPAIRPAGTTSDLLCGTDGFGFRHIEARHGPDWQNIALYTGENWRDLADFAIEQVLSVPQPGYPQYNPKNDSWRFKAPLQIKDDEGTVRDTYYPVVAVAAQDGKILTAFPTRDPR